MEMHLLIAVETGQWNWSFDVKIHPPFVRNVRLDPEQVLLWHV
jgi:hypothetical protein